jgi:hypothetical protein
MIMMKTPLTLLAATVSTLIGLPLSAAHAESADVLWQKGKVMLDARTRYEYVNDDSAKDPAEALTVRIRPAFQTGTWNGLSGLIEGEATATVVDDYNSTRNNNIKHLNVVDPESAEINQLLLKYVYSPMFDATLGRQRINLDNQRFIGGVAWRQNEQTYDGLSFNVKPTKELGFYYAYINQVNTIFGSKDPKPTFKQAQASTQDSDIHVMQAKYAYSPLLSVVAYGYLMDFKDLAASSNSTYGIRFAGKQDALRYVAEYAKQSDYADQPVSYSADYYTLELGYTLPAGLPKADVSVGYEMLGSDGGKIGFQTPLATKHKFNGWTDMFLATPANGLTDLYMGLNVSVLEKGKLMVEAHQYESDKGGIEYGSEYGASFSHPLPVKGLSALGKYSSYNAKKMGADTDKIWLQLDYKY